MRIIQFMRCTRCDAQTGNKAMKTYEVSNVTSAHSFGAYQADTAAEAIEAACKDAGYESKAEAEAAMGRETELIAVEIK